MPNDPAHVGETRAWFLNAADDLRAGEYHLLAQAPLTSYVRHGVLLPTTGREIHEVVLTWQCRSLRNAHILVEVGQARVEIDPSLQSLLRRAAELTEYAFAFRYPGDPTDITLQEGEGALATGRAVYDAILDRLPSEVHP